MFGVVLLSAVTAMQIYVLARARTVPLFGSPRRRRLLVVAGVLLWAAFLGGRFLGQHGDGAAARALEQLGMGWMAALFLTTVCLLAVDLATGFGLLFARRQSPRLRGLALALGGVLSLAALVQGLRPPVVHDYEVALPGLPRDLDGTVVVALSDLHVGALLDGRWLRARVDQVQALHPDLVVLLGDVFEGHGPPRGSLVESLRRLHAPLGVLAVLGNHEAHGGGAPAAALLEAAGCEVLRDRWVQIRPGLVVAGVDDLTTLRRRGVKSDAVAKALEGRPPGGLVLLSHTPWRAEEAAARGVGLMLSGHTHGGQIWPFGYLVRLAYPLFEGRYDVDGMTAIVSRGAGTWGPRMRLWAPGEILRITLRARTPAPSDGGA